MSLPEEAGKVANNAINSLRGSPGLLVLVLLQVLTLGVLAFISQDSRTRQQTREMYVLQRCLGEPPHPGKE